MQLKLFTPSTAYYHTIQSMTLDNFVIRNHTAVLEKVDTPREGDPRARLPHLKHKTS
jgi:hypothetical protein